MTMEPTAIYVALLFVMQVCRSLRWNNLLAPLGIHVPTGPMLAISAVGFMEILALPARLGELVRPGLLRKRGVSATAALGTVAVERIVDGLLVSVFVFGACFALRGPASPGWMMVTAWAALSVGCSVHCTVGRRQSRPSTCPYRTGQQGSKTIRRLLRLTRSTRRRRARTGSPRVPR